MEKENQKQEKVILTVGRHEAYNDINPIYTSGRINSAYLAQMFKDLGMPIEKIFCSTTERAIETSKVRALISACEFKQLDTLREHCSIKECFNNEILPIIRGQNYRHVHIVAHEPNIENLTKVSLGTGQCIIFIADSWEDIFEGNRRLLGMDGNFCRKIESEISFLSDVQEVQSIKNYLDGGAVKKNVIKKIISFKRNLNAINSDSRVNNNSSFFDLFTVAKLTCDLKSQIESLPSLKTEEIESLGLCDLCEDITEKIKAIEIQKRILRGHPDYQQLNYEEIFQKDNVKIYYPYSLETPLIWNVFVKQEVKDISDIALKTDNGIICINFVKEFPSEIKVIENEDLPF